MIFYLFLIRVMVIAIEKFYIYECIYETFKKNAVSHIFLDVFGDKWIKFLESYLV